MPPVFLECKVFFAAWFPEPSVKAVALLTLGQPTQNETGIGSVFALAITMFLIRSFLQSIGFKRAFPKRICRSIFQLTIIVASLLTIGLGSSANSDYCALLFTQNKPNLELFPLDIIPEEYFKTALIPDAEVPRSKQSKLLSAAKTYLKLDYGLPQDEYWDPQVFLHRIKMRAKRFINYDPQNPAQQYLNSLEESLKSKGIEVKRMQVGSLLGLPKGEDFGGFLIQTFGDHWLNQVANKLWSQFRTKLILESFGSYIKSFHGLYSPRQKIIFMQASEPIESFKFLNTLKHESLHALFGHLRQEGKENLVTLAYSIRLSPMWPSYRSRNKPTKHEVYFREFYSSGFALEEVKAHIKGARKSAEALLQMQPSKSRSGELIDLAQTINDIHGLAATATDITIAMNSENDLIFSNSKTESPMYFWGQLRSANQNLGFGVKLYFNNPKLAKKILPRAVSQRIIRAAFRISNFVDEYIKNNFPSALTGSQNGVSESILPKIIALDNELEKLELQIFEEEKSESL